MPTLVGQIPPPLISMSHERGSVSALAVRCTKGANNPEVKFAKRQENKFIGIRGIEGK